MRINLIFKLIFAFLIVITISYLYVAKYYKSAEEQHASAYAMATANAMGQGINLGDFYETPYADGELRLKLQPDYINVIANAGFKTVRIPVRWSNHASVDGAARIDEVFASKVEQTVDAFLAKGMYVVLNMHHYRQLDGDELREHEQSVNPDLLQMRFLNMWEQIATRYAKKSPRLIFELYNEPHNQLNNDWNQLAQAGLAVVRKSNPKRLVMIGPAHWNSAYYLNELVLPQDADLIVTIHNYEPFEFTHQGAEWVDSKLSTGITCCDAKQEARAVSKLEVAYRWKLEKGYPVWLGEFGAYSKADLNSRMRFNQMMVKAAAERNINWAYWEFASGFGLYDSTEKKWREGLLQSLGMPLLK